MPYDRGGNKDTTGVPTDRGLFSAEVLGTLSIVGVIYWAVTFFVMHFIQPELNPIDHQISQYANGRLGWLMVSGFVVGGLGVLALAMGLSRSLKPAKRVRTSVILIMLAGLGFIGSGLFKTDIPLEDGTVGYTFPGQMHALAGIVAFLSVVIVSFILAGVFARDLRWQPSRSDGPTVRLGDFDRVLRFARRVDCGPPRDRRHGWLCATDFCGRHADLVGLDRLARAPANR